AVNANRRPPPFFRSPDRGLVKPRSAEGKQPLRCLVLQLRRLTLRCQVLGLMPPHLATEARLVVGAAEADIDGFVRILADLPAARAVGGARHDVIGLHALLHPVDERIEEIAAVDEWNAGPAAAAVAFPGEEERAHELLCLRHAVSVEHSA